MSLARRHALLLAMLAALRAGPAAAAWPTLEEPPRARAEWVAQDSRINGVPTRILRFDSDLPVREVLAYYERQWAQGRGSVRPVRLAGWEGVSTLQGQYHLTVQVKPGPAGSSQGLLSVVDMQDVKRDYVPAGWPRFADTRIVQVMESVDGPRRSQYVQQTARGAFSVHVDRWRREWLQRGLSLTRQSPPDQAGGQPRAWTGLFDREAESVEVSVAERGAGDLVVVVNRTLPRSTP